MLHILNWEKYQARTDKDMPWCKLWGALFGRPWFQKMPDSGKLFTIILLDLARKTGNRIAEEYVFIEYLSGNYGFLSQKKDVFNYLKLLVDNEFLSDNASDIVDKIRIDKTRVDKKEDDIDFISELKKTYPPDLVDTELTKMRGWLLLNTNRKLTKRFAVSWINRNLENNKEIKISEKKSDSRPFPKDA